MVERKLFVRCVGNCHPQNRQCFGLGRNEFKSKCRRIDNDKAVTTKGSVDVDLADPWHL
jgi:hypothetical protein